jgi:hypothetical protein
MQILGIGKSVNSLRKHPKLGDRVTALVTRWKDIARAETAAAAAKQQQETSDHSSGSNNSNDEREHGSGEEEQTEEAISEAKKPSGICLPIPSALYWFIQFICSSSCSLQPKGATEKKGSIKYLQENDIDIVTHVSDLCQLPMRSS